MKVYVIQSTTSGIMSIHKTRKQAHKQLRQRGYHPIGMGFWGEDVSDRNTNDLWVETYEVSE